MDNEIDIVLAIYRGLISNITNKGIPVDMRPQSLIGTVQDDPFDCWIGERIKAVLPPCFEVFHSGQLTTPDMLRLQARRSSCHAIIFLLYCRRKAMPS